MEITCPFLVESALLTHGLVSVSNETLLRCWPEELSCIAWVDAGKIRIGSMAQFLPSRDRAAELCRIDCDLLPEALEKGISGALTASGTMALCARLGIRLAVTCGMGGIGDIRGEELCPDLPALESIPVTLISTSPKDMLDIPATIEWLRSHGVQVVGTGTDRCTGYIFQSTDVPLSGKVEDLPGLPTGKCLILNPIPQAERIQESAFLQMGIQAGKEAEIRGGYYHPAANAAYDRLSGGRSSYIQMQSLIANARLAQKLTR